ncbi:MAG: nuclear transport factor 2 family protein [Deltaproteobacteria bacterium]|nr:nuclear transport factor 2 family protein [Deltaproteobacteria bacterium]
MAIDAATKLEINELLARSAYALDERDLAMLEACFAPNASLVLEIAGGTRPVRFDGRDEVLGLMRDSMAAQKDKRRHVTTNTMVVAEQGGEVSLVSNLTLTSVENGAIRLVTSGLYRDRVRNQGGRWVIVERRIDLDMAY